MITHDKPTTMEGIAFLCCELPYLRSSSLPARLATISFQACLILELGWLGWKETWKKTLLKHFVSRINIYLFLLISTVLVFEFGLL